MSEGQKNTIGQDSKTTAGGNIVLGDDNTIHNTVNHYGSKQINKILGTPPFIPNVFLGRADDLEAVHHKLFKEKNLLLLVNGRGGIGKTTLAAQYYLTYHDQYQHLAWVYISQSIYDGFLSLALALGVTFADQMTHQERLDQVLEAMNSLKKPCLLVIDNANDIQDLEKYYLALRKCPNFHLLLTTRITTFQKEPVHQITALDKAAAFALFKLHYPQHLEAENDLLDQILSKVAYNTLVIELLAKNLYSFNQLEKKYSLTNLYEDLQSQGVLRLSKSDRVQVSYQPTGHGLRTEKPEDIIAAMYDLGQLSEAERQLLSIFAVLPAENIPYHRLKGLLPTVEDLDKTLLALAQKGWLEYNKDNAFFKVSPVIQEITRLKNEDLQNHCASLLDGLSEKLDYEPGTGHFINVTYEEAAILTRYAENITELLKINSYNFTSLHNYIGNYYTTTGNLNKALYYYNQGMLLGEKLVETDSNNAHLKNLLNIFYNYLGNTYSTLGNIEKALFFYTKSQQNALALTKLLPEEYLYKSNLAISYSKLGETQSSLGNLEKALGYFEERSRIGKELYESYPENVSFKNGLAISYEKLGETQSSLGNLEKALGYFEDETELFEELYESYPENVSFKNGLAISYSKLGETQSSLGNLEKALGYFEDETELFEELYESYPENVSFKNGLAISYSKLGETQSSLGNLEKALGYFEEDAKLSKELYESYPENVSFKNGLAISYERLGDTQSSLGNLEKALGYFDQYNELEKELYESYPENVEFKNNLAISYEKLGDTQSSLGNLEKALGYFEEETELFEELYESYPENVSFKNGLAISYTKLASIYVKQGDTRKANGFYQQAKILWEELVERAPQYAKFKSNLAWVKGKLG
ncbi:MAG: NB-ARC domain-containing protein [Saprospiraceae bacterium]